MTVQRLLKHAVIAKMLDHPRADAYWDKAFKSADISYIHNELARATSTLSKKTFFLRREMGSF